VTADYSTTPSTASIRPIVTTVGYFTAFVALGLAYASLGPTLTDLATNVGADLVRISYVFTGRGLGYLVGSVLGGRLYDKVRGHPVMAGVLVLIAVVLGLIPLVSGLWLLIALIFLIGVFEGGLDVGGNTLLVWVHGDRVDPYMNAMHFFFGVGASLSPVIIAQAVTLTAGIRWAYWVLALLVLPVAVMIARLPSPAPPGADDDGAGRHDGAHLRRNQRLVTLIALFFFLYVGVESGFGGWIATYAKAMGLGDTTTAAYLTSVFWGALTIGRLLSIPLAARFEPRQILLADLIGCLISVSVLMAWPNSATAVWAGTFGAGLAMASMFPTALSFAERRMTITGTITSRFFVGGSTGGMVLPWVIGQLFEPVGAWVAIVVILGGVILDLVIYSVIVAHTQEDDARAEQRAVVETSWRQ
jgi:FHS family Na+ dependent glucose MFS transporter 1